MYINDRNEFVGGIAMLQLARFSYSTPPDC